MSPFEFGLQKVLDLREQTEKERARQLSDAERRVEAARARLEEFREIRDTEAEKLAQAHGQSRRVGHIHNLTRAIQQLSERVHRAEAACREARADVEMSRTELKEAMTERRVLDTLREKQESAWRYAMKSDEQRRMDELALTRFQRRDENGGAR